MQTLRLRLQSTESSSSELPSSREKHKTPRKPFEDRLFDRLFEIYDHCVSHALLGLVLIVFLCSVSLLFGAFVSSIYAATCGPNTDVVS